ncbi:MAG: LnmK family bifunctional acyltransferase/decarboxylase [Vicinamibacterales bacterium]
MTLGEARRTVVSVVAELARLPDGSVDLARPATAHGIDSLALLVLREMLESRLGLHISDEAWLRMETLDDIASYAISAPVGSSRTSQATSSRAAPVDARTGLAPDGRFHDSFEIGMPMTGTYNLAEGPLLKHLGHLRWAHMSAVSGVPSRDVMDAEGHRLYPTFFYVDLCFPPARHMGTFGENDRIDVVCTLERFGHSMLDGLAFMVPGDQGPYEPHTLDSEDRALAAGVPVARLSCIFVKQFDGAAWLKRSRPAVEGFERIAEAAAAPDAYEITKAAARDGRFERPLTGLRPLTHGWTEVDYTIVPERDLNGAGLIYFANYPVILDICERQILQRAEPGFSLRQLARRSLIRRQSAYLNNASADDTLTVEMEAFLAEPARPAPGSAEDNPTARLLIHHRMRRRSDGRVMLVSAAEKLIPAHDD